MKRLALVTFTAGSDEEFNHELMAGLFDTVVKPVLPAPKLLGWQVEDQEVIHLLVETGRTTNVDDWDTMSERLDGAHGLLAMPSAWTVCLGTFETPTDPGFHPHGRHRS